MDLSPALESLTDKQRVYVQARLEGSSPSVAARRCGLEHPEKNWRVMEIHQSVRTALAQGREISIKATGITREKISEMFMEAFRNAANAMEQIAAARELGKLHGVYEANKLQVEHNLKGIKDANELRALPLAELERLALEGEFEDITVSPERALVRRA